MNDSIDIITVNFNDEFHINKNILNYSKIKEFQFNWIVGDNSGTLGNLNYERTKVISGLEYKIFDHPALHHTNTLNNLYDLSTSDLVVVTDPDFYIYNLDSFCNIINDVISNDLFIFGVPWHPKWSRKYSNFPAIHFMIINKNASTYQRNLIDFRPTKLSFNFTKDLFRLKSYSLLNKFKYFFIRSSTIYNDGDTGSRIFHFKSIIKYKLFFVLIQKNENYLEFNNFFIILTDYFFKKKYLDYNYIKTINHSISKDCEFFLYQSEIFGFHFRGNTKLNRDKFKEVLFAEELLQRKLNE